MISLFVFSLLPLSSLLINLLSPLYPQHARRVGAHLLKASTTDVCLVVRPRIEARTRTSRSRSRTDAQRHFKLDKERRQYLLQSLSLLRHHELGIDKGGIAQHMNRSLG
jgi:hypothetical protein